MSSYEFITDLPDNWNELASPDLKRMHKFWLRAKKQFEENNPEELRTFNSQLAREWSIETGIIENIYSINRGITQTLIEKGIQESYIQHGSTDKPAEIIVPILNAQKNALEMAFSFIKNERELSSSFIKELHAAITQHQDTTITKDVFGTIKEVPLRRGDWKLLPNNPTRSDGTVFFYCPPEHVAAEIDRLLEMHRNHQNQGVPPEIEAAWLHHRFAQIHPFQDGNGRVARVLASLVMIRANLFPVIIYREQRSEYIDALEEADSGDLVKFIGLLSQNQMKAARQAIKFVETSVPEPILLEKDEIEVIIKSGVEARRRKKEKVQKQLLETSSRLSHLLEKITYQRLIEIADTLNREFKEFDKDKWENETYAEVKKIEDRDGLYYGIILNFLMMGTDFSTATETYFKCMILSIDDVEKTEIGFFFQALGPEFTGGICVLGGIWDPEYEPYDKFGKPKTIFADGSKYQEKDDYENIDFIGSEFQFSDLDSDDELELISNYKKWLEKNLKEGLRSWHDHI